MNDEVNYGFREEVYAILLDKEKILDLIETELIVYQEEATSKWSSEKEREIASKQYDAIYKLYQKLTGD